jgi:hypothetical protein
MRNQAQARAANPSLSAAKLKGMADALRYSLDPVTFATDLLDWRPDPWQAEVLREPSKRVLLCCSRQAGKSTTVAVMALHTALHQPGSLVLLLSPTDRQSKNLFQKVVDFLRALKEKPTLKEDNIHSMTFASGSRIISLPGNNADTIRGYSAPALVVLDEAAYINDALYTALRPMLAVGRGRLVMLSTPNGKHGAFYDAWSSNSSDWRRIEVKAEQCPRISPDFLAEERRVLGDMLFGQEYECQFACPCVIAYDPFNTRLNGGVDVPEARKLAEGVRDEIAFDNKAYAGGTTNLFTEGALMSAVWGKNFDPNNPPANSQQQVASGHQQMWPTDRVH